MEGTILVIEDELQYQRLVRFNLEPKGYHVTSAFTGEEALNLVGKTLFDIVLLDIVLPDIDGFELLQQIREISSVPVIAVTARAGQWDLLRGLALGADDYITKPYSPLELLARVEAVLRRTRVAESPEGQSVFRLGDLEINFLNRQVSMSEKHLTLSPTEYRLLCCLASKPGAVLTHEDLLEKTWGPNYRGETELLRASVWRLRKKVEADPSKPRYIITRPGVGYVLDNSEQDREAASTQGAS